MGDFWYISQAGKRRGIGFGPAHRGSLARGVGSLTDARDLAQAARDLLHRGMDPLEDRAGQRAAAQVRVVVQEG